MMDLFPLAFPLTAFIQTISLEIKEMEARGVEPLFRPKGVRTNPYLSILPVK